MYVFLNQLFWNYISLLRGKMTKEVFSTSKKGYTDSLDFIRSEEYRMLPEFPIVNEHSS